MKRFDSTIGLCVAALAVLPGCPGDSGDDDGAGTVGATSTPTTNDPTMADPTMADETGPTPMDLPPIECGDGTFEGSLSLDGAAEVAMLDGIRRVTGEVQVDKTGHTNLDFMRCLEEIDGDLTIFGNDLLTDVSGLDSLTSVKGHIFISENSALPDLNGLNNIQVVDRDATNPMDVMNKNLIIRRNDAMTQISGLTSLTVIYGNLTIQDNESLMNIDGLKGLRAVGGVLAITNNPQLCISSVNCVGAGIEQPATPPDTWSTSANNEDC